MAPNTIKHAAKPRPGFLFASTVALLLLPAGLGWAQAEPTAAINSTPDEKLQAAIDLGEINVHLKPMSPSKNTAGLRWSPKGTKIAMKQTRDYLAAKLVIGKFELGLMELHIQPLPQSTDSDPESPQSKQGSQSKFSGTLKLDLNGNGTFEANEIEQTNCTERRGKYWFSFNRTIELPLAGDQKREFPISLWHVVDPDEKEHPQVIRWSRRGWHEGTAKVGDVECSFVISDADADGVFDAEDAWGVATDSKSARANSSNRVAGYCWLNGIAFQVVDVDPNGQFLNVKAIDPGVTEAEDRERKDPYAKDRRYPRAEKPFPFAKTLDDALAQAKQENKKVVIDFVTDWCGPCRTMDQWVYTAQPIAQLSKRFVFVKVDGDKHKDLKEKYKVEAFPTIVLADAEGTPLKTTVGYQGVSQLQKFVGEK